MLYIEVSILPHGFCFSIGMKRVVIQLYIFLCWQIVDGYIGEIMDAYVKADIFDQTLFIIVSDHGG